MNVIKSYRFSSLKKASILFSLFFILGLSVHAQLDESVLHDRQLLALVDEKLDSLSEHKRSLFYLGLFEEVLYINKIENKREEGTLTKEEAEEFLISWQEMRTTIADFAERLVGDWGIRFGKDPTKAGTITEHYQGVDSEYEEHMVDLGKEIDLSQYAENGKINFLTPGGSIVSLPKEAKPTFTGKTSKSDLNSTLYKGVLLGFVDEKGDTWTSRFKPAESGYLFRGYVKSDTEGKESFPYEGATSSGTVLVGSEMDNCKLRISSGTFTATAYKYDELSPILTSTATDFDFIKEIDLKSDDCKEIILSDYIYLAEDIIKETESLREANFESDAQGLAEKIDASDDFVIFDGNISFNANSEKKLEALDEKLKMLSHATGKLFVVAFTEVSYAIPKASLNEFSKQILIKSKRLSEASEAFIVSIPIYSSSRIPVEGPLKLEKFYVGMQSAYATNEQTHSDFDPSLEVYENVIASYKKIEKPYKQIVHFLRVDGTAGSFVTENKEKTTGQRNIIDIILYYDKSNIEKVAEYTAKIREAAERKDVYRTQRLINEKSLFIKTVLETSTADNYEELDFETRLRETAIEAPSKIDGIPNHIAYSKSIFKLIYVSTSSNLDFAGGDVAEGALFDIDLSKYVYGAVDAASIALIPIGLDFIPDAVGAIYAASRDDHVYAGIYGASIVLVGGTDILIKTLKGERFIIRGGKAHFKGTTSFATNIKSALNTTDNALPNSPKIFEFLSNKVLKDKIDDAVARGLDKNKLYNDLGSSEQLMDAFLKNPELVDAWKAVGKHTDLRANTRFLENISSYSDNLLKQLDDDLLNPKWSNELKTLFKESSDDVTNVWKQLKDDPSYAWEISKTGDSRWQKWSKREFFKDVTALGKKFEAETVLRTLKDRSSQWYGSLKGKVSADFGKNLDDYDMFSQVQLKYDGDNYFVADQVFVKYDDFGDIEDIIVMENKLKSSTQLTTPQTNALSRNSYSVRNVKDKVSELSSSNNRLRQNDNLIFDGEIKWYKVYDSDNGNVITGIEKL